MLLADIRLSPIRQLTCPGIVSWPLGNASLLLIQLALAFGAQMSGLTSASPWVIHRFSFRPSSSAAALLPWPNALAVSVRATRSARVLLKWKSSLRDFCSVWSESPLAMESDTSWFTRALVWATMLMSPSSLSSCAPRCVAHSEANRWRMISGTSVPTASMASAYTSTSSSTTSSLYLLHQSQT